MKQMIIDARAAPSADCSISLRSLGTFGRRTDPVVLRCPKPLVGGDGTGRVYAGSRTMVQSRVIAYAPGSRGVLLARTILSRPHGFTSDGTLIQSSMEDDGVIQFQAFEVMVRDERAAV